MLIRHAQKEDWPQIVALAARFNLDYEGMEADDFWVATEGSRVVGICGLRRHADCQELCSLGVEETSRHRGVGTRLVMTLLQETKGDIYLATVVPEFFKRLSFEEATSVPPSMVKKAEWCAGCRRDLCTILLLKR